jgi:hypothetical protein
LTNVVEGVQQILPITSKEQPASNKKKKRNKQIEAAKNFNHGAD